MRLHRENRGAKLQSKLCTYLRERHDLVRHFQWLICDESTRDDKHMVKKQEMLLEREATLIEARREIEKQNHEAADRTIVEAALRQTLGLQDDSNLEGYTDELKR